MQARSKDRLFTLLFCLIPTTWAGSFIAAKYVVAEIDPLSSTFWRFMLASLVMFPLLAVWQGRSHPRLGDMAWWRHIGLVVLFSGIGYHVLFFMGIERTTPTNAAVIIALNPFFTTLLEVLVFRRARPVRFYIGFALSFAGATWVNLSRGGRFDLANLGMGELLCLLAALCWSVFTIGAKLTKKPEWSSLWINAYNCLLTAGLLFGGLVLFRGLPVWRMSPTGWNGLWFMAVFPTAIGYTIFYIGVQKKGPAWAVNFIYLVPSCTVLLDYLFFHAGLTMAVAGGTAVVIAGLFIAHSRRYGREMPDAAGNRKNPAQR